MKSYGSYRNKTQGKIFSLGPTWHRFPDKIDTWSLVAAYNSWMMGWAFGYSPHHFPNRWISPPQDPSIASPLDICTLHWHPETPCTQPQGGSLNVSVSQEEALPASDFLYGSEWDHVCQHFTHLHQTEKLQHERLEPEGAQRTSSPTLSQGNQGPWRWRFNHHTAAPNYCLPPSKARVTRELGLEPSFCLSVRWSLHHTMFLLLSLEKSQEKIKEARKA